jgi:hypothetical protein
MSVSSSLAEEDVTMDRAWHVDHSTPNEGLSPPDRAPGDAGVIRFRDLNARAHAITDDHDSAIRLLILRFLLRRAEDAAARAAADRVTGGAWGRLERRALLALGPGASTNSIAAWMARVMGLTAR